MSETNKWLDNMHPLQRALAMRGVELVNESFHQSVKSAQSQADALFQVYSLDIPLGDSPAPSFTIELKDQDGNLYQGTLYLVDGEVRDG